MSSTAEMITTTPPVDSKPAWVKDESSYSILFQPAQGDLAVRAVAQRADDYAANLKVKVVEVARVRHPKYRDHEAVYVRTEPLS